MGVKTGYKQTEVGVIPEDWVVKTIAEIAPLQRGFDLPTTQLKEGSYPVVYSNGILNFHKKAMVHGPGVITGRSGTLGKVHYIESDYWPHNTTLWVTRFNDNYPRYIYYLYNLIDFERFASGSGVPTLNRNDAHDFHVAIPSNRTEQTTIATALSDADALIQSLERLIAKKRDIKQGAMQELLTGKKRLPGFEKKKGYKQTDVGAIPEDWEIRPLEYAVEFLDMQRRPIKSSDRIKMAGIYPYYGASGIIDYVNGYLFDEDLILLGEDGENILSRTMRLAFRVSGKIWVNNHAHVLRPKLGIDIGYITEYLESRDYKEYNSGTAQPKLNRQTCSRIPVALPHIAEQTSIATVLSDLDAEIAALDSKLAKARQIKQGMMQELLTGRIRLT